MDTRIGIAIADTHTDYGHQVRKIWRCKKGPHKGIFGCAGDDTAIARFEDWILRGGPKPEQILPRRTDDISENFQVIQMYEGRIYLWDQAMRGEESVLPYAAVGSGAPWALGAMDAGADVFKALEIASRRDSGTKPPFTQIEV